MVRGAFWNGEDNVYNEEHQKMQVALSQTGYYNSGNLNFEH
ncbi:hypothetical protein E6C60_4025 [Paenibacillus algicola]|uniref:Uncharacterized protein n=1 Tax=Paenibacillus algicola TaxID=2565926 RepID=A0A4P8XRY0_9BACL|nr:hypothetical protein E6C60_4025 [Paenibacillus algicola]